MHEIELSEVVLRSDLTGGVSRTGVLHVGDTLQRDAGTVTGLTLVGDAIEVQTDSALWLVTVLGWVRVAPPVERRVLSDAEAALCAPGAMFAGVNKAPGAMLADVNKKAKVQQ